MGRATSEGNEMDATRAPLWFLRLVTVAVATACCGCLVLVENRQAVFGFDGPPIVVRSDWWILVLIVSVPASLAMIGAGVYWFAKRRSRPAVGALESRDHRTAAPDPSDQFVRAGPPERE